MNTLLTLNQQPFHIITIKPTNDQTTKFLINSNTFNTFPCYYKTSWKLHARSKGFGNTSKNTPIQKNENVSKSSSTQQKQDQEEVEEDKIPQIVFDRMLKRILISVGVPMGIGVVVLKLIDYLKENGIWDVPLWVAFLTTFVFFGSSVIGVVYGSLSTSWDAEKKGSILGLDEAKVNWTEMWKEEEQEDNNN